MDVQDGCGIVLAGKFKGQVVIIDPSIGWGDNDLAPKGSLEILGMPRDGCFAQTVVVPEINLYPKPAHLSNQQAAALPLAGVTAYRALVNKGKPKPGSRVLVTGVGGGVAVFAVQFAVAMGCEVFVTSSSPAKIEAAKKQLGCKGGVLYTEPGWAKNLLKLAGGKFDICIDGAGGDGLSEVIRVMSGGGRIVSYGSTAGPANLNLAPLFLNNLELCGTAMGSPRDFQGMLALVNAKRIVPLVDQVFRLRDFPLALDKMRAGGQLGKLVLDHEDSSKSFL